MRCQRFGNIQHNCGYVPGCVACSEAHLSGDSSNPKQQLKLSLCGGKITANYQAVVSGKHKGGAYQLGAT